MIIGWCVGGVAIGDDRVPVKQAEIRRSIYSKLLGSPEKT
jgi:hypothetical protein